MLACSHPLFYYLSLAHKFPCLMDSRVGRRSEALLPAVVLWSVFPVTWFATQLDLIGSRNSELIFMVANWVAKVSGHA